MNQAGIENVVASSGTALTQGQLRLIKRYTDNLNIVYDGDEAGKKAATRGGELALEEDLKVKVLILPDKHDPDSFIRETGAAQFEKYFDEHAIDYILYKINYALELSSKDPIQKAELTTDIIASVAKMPDPLKRSVYVKEISRRLEIAEQIIITECNKSRRRFIDQKQKADRSSTVETKEDPINLPTYKYESEELGYTKEDYLKKFEKSLLKLIMEYGPLEIQEGLTVTKFILEELEDISFEDEKCKIIFDLIDNELKNGNLPDSKFYITNSNEKIADFAIDLLLSKYELSDNWYNMFEIYTPLPGDVFKNTVQSKVNMFKVTRIEQMIVELGNKIKETEYGDGKDMNPELKKLLNVGKKLQEKRNEILQKEGIDIYRSPIIHK